MNQFQLKMWKLFLEKEFPGNYFRVVYSVGGYRDEIKFKLIDKNNNLISDYILSYSISDFSKEILLEEVPKYISI